LELPAFHPHRLSTHLLFLAPPISALCLSPLSPYTSYSSLPCLLSFLLSPLRAHLCFTHPQTSRTLSEPSLLLLLSLIVSLYFTLPSPATYSIYLLSTFIFPLPLALSSITVPSLYLVLTSPFLYLFRSFLLPSQTLSFPPAVSFLTYFSSTTFLYILIHYSSPLSNALFLALPHSLERPPVCTTLPLRLLFFLKSPSLPPALSFNSCLSTVVSSASSQPVSSPWPLLPVTSCPPSSIHLHYYPDHLTPLPLATFHLFPSRPLCTPHPPHRP
jgi:hypothetical protein